MLQPQQEDMLKNSMLQPQLEMEMDDALKSSMLRPHHYLTR